MVSAPLSATVQLVTEHAASLPSFVTRGRTIAWIGVNSIAEVTLPEINCAARRYWVRFSVLIVRLPQSKPNTAQRAPYFVRTMPSEMSPVRLYFATPALAR